MNSRRRLGRMASGLTYEYWRDQRWYVGRVREVPGAISQGRTRRELEANLRDACRLLRRRKRAKRLLRPRRRRLVAASA